MAFSGDRMIRNRERKETTPASGMPGWGWWYGLPPCCRAVLYKVQRDLSAMLTPHCQKRTGLAPTPSLTSQARRSEGTAACSMARSRPAPPADVHGELRAVAPLASIDDMAEIPLAT